VVISNVGGSARWAVDTSGPTGFGDGVEDAAVLFGLSSDIHLLGDVRCRWIRKNSENYR